MPAKNVFTSTVIICLLLLGAADSLADDVGITRARLIQKSEKSYVLETDVTRALVWAIKVPIFPDRFQVSELEYVNRAGWIVVQVTATTSGRPLTPVDEILLPWMRNGAAITVQWLDGSVAQGLFLRTLEGIHLPLRLLMPSSLSLGELCRKHFVTGLNHLAIKWIHVFFAGSLTLLLPWRQAFNGLLYYAFGQGVALILADVGLPGFDLLFVEVSGAILIFLIAYGSLRKLSIDGYFPLLFLFGLIHGLAYGQELSQLDFGLEKKLPAMFMFNIALDLGHFLAAGMIVLIVNFFKISAQWHKITSYASGILSVVLLLVLFQEHVVTGQTDVLNLKSSQIATRFALPVSQKSQTAGQRPPGARRLTSPVVSYLTVEPYEVRQEILIQARAAVQFLGVDDKGMGSIPLQSLEPVKNGILAVFQSANSIVIDGQQIKPSLTRADFVTLGAAGVVVRPDPVPESLNNGIIGLTLVYETPVLADEIVIDWKLFSSTVQKVQATTTDPFGGNTMILSPEKNILRYKSRLAGYRVPVIEEIPVEKQMVPVISIMMFLAALILFIFSIRRKKFSFNQPAILGLVALGLVLYPFISHPVDIPFVAQWNPSTERTAKILERLLTNVYRSFDVRDEDRVYDRLAMSVMGDQLEQIYLQNRQSLELENRGGARAKVDAVDIISINKVTKSDGQGFVADAIWTVGGSVSHFGHTHYRRNRNHALVTFVMDDDSWKINKIELIDEKRLL